MNRDSWLFDEGSDVSPDLRFKLVNIAVSDLPCACKRNISSRCGWNFESRFRTWGLVDWISAVGVAGSTFNNCVRRLWSI